MQRVGEGAAPQDAGSLDTCYPQQNLTMKKFGIGYVRVETIHVYGGIHV